MIRTKILRPILVSALLILCGCASTTEMMRENPDPLEGYNRPMFAFNEEVDKAVIKPIAEAYKTVTPVIVDEGITNFFGNLADIAIAANNVLQFKFHDVAIDLSRIVFNTTFGLLGFFDVASPMGLPKHNEDFGQTLGYWTDLEGYYLVLPILGPSSTRDVLGLATDNYVFYPLVYGGIEPRERNIALGLNFIDTRADMLRAEKVLEEAAVDRYAYVRDAYMQRRRNLVYDGNPPRLEPDFENPDGNDSNL